MFKGIQIDIFKGIQIDMFKGIQIQMFIILSFKEICYRGVMLLGMDFWTINY